MTLSILAADQNMSWLPNALAEAFGRFHRLAPMDLEIAEILPLYVFKANNNLSIDNPQKEHFEDSGRLHIQIFAGGIAKYYARAKVDELGKWAIVGLHESPLAGKIEIYLEELYRSDPSDIISVGLLEAPSYYSMALMLISNLEPRIISVTSADQNFVRDGTNLSLQDFTEKLNKSKPFGLKYP